MNGHRAALGLACGLLAVCAAAALAAEQKPEDKQTVSSKADKRTPATGVNFKKSLNLPFASLGTLGSRIEAARRAPDPVALANAAHELHVAEKVSGKQASLTSSALVKEAAELAALRRQVAEMKATLHVANQIQQQTSTLQYLNSQLTTTRQMIKQETAAVQSNKEPTDAPRKILVNNYTTQYIDVYVNGFLKLQLEPGQSQWCVIEHKWNPTVLKAYGNEDAQVWGPRYVWGRFKTYTWNLN